LRILAYISFLFLLSSCDLDHFMFNANNEIPAYELDDYTGEVDFVLDSEYDIPNDKVHLFKIPPKTDRNFDLWAVYIGDTAQIKSDTVIVYCHGNRDHMDFYWPRAKLMANLGSKNRYGIFMMDYQGFGMSGGTATEENMIDDVDEGLAWLKSMGLTDSRTIIYGFSLGGTPAVYHAANNSELNPSILILENTFASTDVIVQDATGLAVPVEMFASAKHDVARQIKSVFQPFLQFHGLDDTYLPIATHGNVINENYSGARNVYYQVEGAEHGNLPEAMTFEAYLDAMLEFISGG
jgi:fermentation-respiration switch protein FrsA (DUF1100 family)